MRIVQEKRSGNDPQCDTSDTEKIGCSVSWHMDEFVPGVLRAAGERGECVGEEGVLRGDLGEQNKQILPYLSFIKSSRPA